MQFYSQIETCVNVLENLLLLSMYVYDLYLFLTLPTNIMININTNNL